MTFTIENEIALFGGKLLKVQHESVQTATPMKFNLYIPETYSDESNLPVLLYLSGLTCNPDNASEKSGVFYFASKYKFAVLLPDTSPRGAKIEGEDESWDFGTGAGFYVDSLKDPWTKNYNMYSYVSDELLGLVHGEFKGLDFGKISITGHSMGGYGAIMMYFKNPGKFTSCSAFAPICNPSVVPWGEKCFGNYLGDDKKEWLKYDPCELIKEYQGNDEILIHVGDKDVFNYRDNQLRCQNLVEAAKGTSMEGKINLNVVEGYDHSYYFVSSFIPEHVEFHVKSWTNNSK